MLRVADTAAGAEIDGPRIDISGHLFTPREGHPQCAANDLDKDNNDHDSEQYSQRIQKWADSIPSLPFSMEDQKSLCVYASNFALERVAHYLSLVANAIA